jgi:hypothetical protein
MRISGQRPLTAAGPTPTMRRRDQREATLPRRRRPRNQGHGFRLLDRTGQARPPLQPSDCRVTSSGRRRSHGYDLRVWNIRGTSGLGVPGTATAGLWGQSIINARDKVAVTRAVEGPHLPPSQTANSDNCWYSGPSLPCGAGSRWQLAVSIAALRHGDGAL